MSYTETLRSEINAKIDELDRTGQEWSPQWIAHTVCAAHDDGLAQNEHAEFWKYGGYKTCREETRRCINRRAGDEESAELQMVFEGFEHLQRYYVVERKGDSVGIPVEQLSDEELQAKAALHRSFGAAHFAHADEIDRFIGWRTAPPMFAEELPVKGVKSA